MIISAIFTIIGGLAIFIIGQSTLKLVIEPIQEFKKAISEVSFCLLINQAKICNPSRDDDIANQVKKCSANLLSSLSKIFHYKFACFVFGLPNKKNVLLASRELNSIYHSMLGISHHDNNVSSAQENINSLKKISTLLNMPTNYQSITN